MLAMRVNGASNWIYPARFGNVATVSSDIAGPLTIEVDFPSTLTDIKVQPQSAGIITSGLGTQTATFSISDHGHYSVELNGTSNPLFLAVMPLETSPPNSGDVTYYFGPGLHDLGGEIVLTSNQTCYIAGGALINGKLRIGPGSRTGATANNCVVSGRGIIDSSVLPNTGVASTSWGRAARIQKATNSTISGITFVGMEHWNVVLYESSNVTLDWVRSLNSRRDDNIGTPDGIDIVGSNTITICNTFVHSYDDAIAVKCSKNGWYGDSASIQICDIVIWQGDGGNALEIGYENDDAYSISGITYQRVEIIRKTARADTYRRAAIGIHATGASPISDVIYEDITVQSVQENNIYIASFASTDYPGHVTRALLSNIMLRRVALPLNALPIVIESEDASTPVTTVTFDNCTQGLSHIANSSGMALTNISGLSFI